MVMFKSNDLDQLLRDYYKLEAEKVAPLDSKLKWAELRERLDKTGLAFAEQSEEKVAKVAKGSPWLFCARLFSKHKALTSLAAACFLFFILYHGIHPSSPVKDYVAGIFSPNGGPMLQMSRADDSPATLKPELDKDLDKDSEKIYQADLPKEENGAPVEEAEVSIAAVPETITPTPPKADDSQALLPADRPPDTGYGDAQLEDDTFFITTIEEAQEAVFHDYALFQEELQKAGKAFPGHIYELKSIPRGFAFQQGIVSRRDQDLSFIHQELTGLRGEIITLNQDFYPEHRAEEPRDGAEEGATDYLEFGNDRAYLTRWANDYLIIKWVKDNSLITLTGLALDEETLISVFHLLTGS